MFREGGDQQLFLSVLEAVELMKSFAESSGSDAGISTTAFSDNIVITAPGPFGSAGVTATCELLGSELLKRGILCRGAVTVGRTYHSENIVFGEGLVQAYDLERKVARYPRIIIDDPVVPSIFNLLDLELAIPRFKRDRDGTLFINLFSSFWMRAPLTSESSVVDYLDAHLQGRPDIDAFESFGELLKKKVEDARRPDIPDEIRERVRENVNWVVEQFNETINGVLKNEIQPVQRA